jgi:integrase
VTMRTRHGHPGAGHSGLLGKLVAAVRPEFRTGVLVPDPDDLVLGRRTCPVPGCDRARAEYGLCTAHGNRWRERGRPALAEFLADPGPPLNGRRPLTGCTVTGCRYGSSGFELCMRHRRAWETITLPPQVASWAIRQARSAGVTSLLDYSAAQWQDLTAARRSTTYQAFLLFARDVVEALAEGTGWEAEFPRDVWRLHRLHGLTINPGKAPHPRIHLRFDRITQPWLRACAKRWARLRLSSGLTVGTVQADVVALARFSAFLTDARAGALRDIDRPLLERYLAWLASQPIGHGAREDAITTLGTFFQAIRQHGWDDDLPATALLFPGDIPPRPPRLTRHLAEHIMTQVEAPANLSRWTTPEGRLITLILIRCGLRASDGCTLAFDCLLRDGQDAPYLRYYNHKMRREAAVPIDEELEAEIRAQQHRVAGRWPGRHPHLFPGINGNAGGQHPLTYYSYRGMLNHWLATCDIRDEHGAPAHLTPHQWRHTFACRLINNDVPQEVIRVLLDHQSTQMTAHYARMTDQTIRRRWEQATKVNIHGERVTLDPDGPLAQAQWAKTRYGIATQTLPNGYCGLPIQKTCPHANACLTCPVFITGPEFLPELRQQHQRTLTLIGTAKASGQARVTEMNNQVAANLRRMISELEALNHHAPEAADAS